MKTFYHFISTVLFFAIACLLNGSLFAQAPDGINYQAVARNNSGNILANSSVAIRVSIHDGSAVGPVVYAERDTATTNAFGLFTCKIGMGNIISGTFATVDWSSGDKYMQVELDPTGGSSYTDLGTTQLLSVPYALYSKNSGGGLWSASGNNISNSNIGNVGIGNASPANKLDVAGAVNSGGSAGGYSFGDRSLSGYSWNLYAQNGIARLLSSDAYGARLYSDTIGKITIGDYSSSAWSLNYSPKLYVLDSARASGYNIGALVEISYGDVPSGGGGFVLASARPALVGYATNYEATYSFSNSMIGVLGVGITRSNSPSAARSYGFYGKAETNNADTRGGYFSADVVSASSTSGNEAYGVHGYARGAGAGAAYGIYAEYSASGTGAHYAGYFNGNLGGTGTYSYTSDAKLKKDIAPITNATALLMQLKPSAYQFRVGEFGAMNLPEGKHYGLIAQETQKVMPELVADNYFPGFTNPQTGEKTEQGFNYLGINYNELIPLLISGIQEQQKLIEALQAEIERLKTK